MKVAVYLAAVPAKAKNAHKRDLLSRFAQGVVAAGDSVELVDDPTCVVEADIAVIQGWVGMKSSPHLLLRQQVIDQQAGSKKHTLVIDSNLFGFLDINDRDRYLRYSLDGVFPTTGHYFYNQVDRSRWQEIKRSYGFRERDWTVSNPNVLICLQRDGGWSMDGLHVMSWLEQVIPIIKSVSARPIVIRPHPGSMKIVGDIRRRWPRMIISDQQALAQDLDQAWCTVTYNSSPGVASLLWGVPAFVTDTNPGRSQAWPEASNDIREIEQPLRPDRTQFYHRIAQCHFATTSLSDGQAWRFMRARLP